MEEIATQAECQGKDVGLQTDASRGEVLTEFEKAKTADVKQELLKVTTQTDECQETATIEAEQDRRHEAEVEALKRDLDKNKLTHDRLRDDLDCCRRETDTVISRRDLNLLYLTQYDSIFGPLPDDCDGKAKRSRNDDWTCNKCKYSVFTRKKQCPKCGTLRRSGK